MITILMPTYNCAEYIGYAIKSILNQTYKDFEFLIIDDGSTDNSESIISQFNDGRIKYMKLPHSGIVTSLNYGISKSTFNVVGIMHADDIAHPDWLKESVAMRKSNRSLDIISCWYVCFINNSIKYVVKTPEDHESIVKGLILYSLISHPGCTFDKDRVLKYSNGYRLDGGIEDYDLWFQLKDKLEFYNIPKPLIFYRLRKTSLSRNSLNDYKKSVHNFQERFFDKLDSTFGVEKSDIPIYRGWREYFYGEKKLARNYWLQQPSCFFSDYRVSIAFLLTYFPKFLLTYLIEKRLRYRMLYLLKYYSMDMRKLRNLLKDLCIIQNL